MFPRQRPQLGGGFLTAKGDGQIVQDEPPVGRRDPIGERAERPAEPEDRRERQRAEQRGEDAVDREDGAIHQIAEQGLIIRSIVTLLRWRVSNSVNLVKFRNSVLLFKTELTEFGQINGMKNRHIAGMILTAAFSGRSP